MKYEVLYENFIDAVRRRIPTNAKISAVLADILLIEKEAVYRRLRMDVPFTFAEIAAISQKLGISLDNIIDSDPLKSRPLQLKLVDYVDPMEMDFLMLENIPELLKKLKNAPHSEMGLSTNLLPQHSYLSYESITRFYLFNWLYLSGATGTSKPFSEVVISERLRKIQMDTLEGLKNVKQTVFVIDKYIYRYLVNNIKYFTSINLIQPQEVDMLKEDLLHQIDDSEKLAIRGHYITTGNRIQIFISNINFENSYLYCKTDQQQVSMIKAFTVNGVATPDVRTYESIRTWINSLKRVSTLISESGEKERIHFFNRQRELVSTL